MALGERSRAGRTAGETPVARKRGGAVPAEANGQPAPAALEAKLDYRFARPALLAQALTHSSLRHEQQMAAGEDGKTADGEREQTRDNERLEFLGDAIVGMLVAESLYRRFPSLREGELTRLRAALVSRNYLGEVGLGLELGQWLHMGRSEERNGGRKKAVLLANCIEAVTAAIYLDSGSLPAAAAFVERAIVAPQADVLYRELKAKHAIGDYKSALQEFLQARGCGQPEYSVEAETGPDHRKRFLVEVRTASTDPGGGRGLARGSGSTKKKAEQEAARRGFTKLQGPDAGGAEDCAPDAETGDAETWAERSDRAGRDLL